jgi:dipeptidyl aminopeptidase/acylaminoacyl peptidase
MSALLSAMPPRILSLEPFTPHTLEHLTQARVFPSPLPEPAYAKMLKEYESLDDVSVHEMVYDSDGLKITGLVAMPSQATGAHPVLIYNRGGSREYGKLTLLNVLRSMVPFAQAGYMVFASNYRGCAGSEGREEFGGSDTHDVLNLLDIARSHDAFDGRNSFMLGHSRGGMMTTLAIKHGAPLNAAISIAGIADARKLVHSTQLLENILKPNVPGFKENPEKALSERSAIDWPGALIRVPLLLLHGDNDKDVHFSDSVRLDEAIRQAGGTSEVVIYPTGSHALIRSWDDVVSRSLNWMERYRIGGRI